MSLIKGKCLKCGMESEVESDEEAGICPHCGAPFVTEKVIRNYNAGKPSSGIEELEKKYNAFIALSKMDHSSMLELYRARGNIRYKERLVNEAIDEYNSLVSESDKWIKRYNNRVDGFNDAKYTAGADSLREKLHRKYVDSAMKKHDGMDWKIKYAREQVEKNKTELEKMLKEEKVLSAEKYEENFGYSVKAKKIAEQMCENYPFDPLGYLYLADWYKREAKREKGLLDYVSDIYEEDSDVMIELENDLHIGDYEHKASLEYEKADKFMTDEYRKLYAEKIKKLKSANRSASGASGSSKSSSNRSASSVKSEKSLPPKKKISNKNRKIKAKIPFGFKVLEFIVGLGVLIGIGAGVFCLLKYGLKLF